MDDGPSERQLNIHIDPEVMGGVYANFANVTFSQYEFTITFARIDHEVEEGDVPGVVVARVNISHKFMRDLLDAMEDTWSKWQTTEGIQEPARDGRRALARQLAARPTPRPSRSAARSSGGSRARGSRGATGSAPARLVCWKSTKSFRAERGSCVAFSADQSASAS